MFNGGGLGQPGERITVRQDINSELINPMLQALAYALIIFPIGTLTAFIDVFVLQPEGIYVVGFVLALFIAFVVFVGGQVSALIPIIGERQIELHGIRGRYSLIAFTIILACVLVAWYLFGYNWLCDMWYGFWPVFTILLWTICLPCVHTPLWVAIFTLSSSIGVFHAVNLLGFRLRYEIPDPMWPPTIQGRSPMTGPYGPGWQPIYEEPDKPVPTVAQTRNGKTAKSWAFYTPPTGVTQKQVYLMCVAIEQTLDADGKYTWPSEGNVSGVGQKPHRKIQDDWEQLGYAKKMPDNTYVLTDKGAVVMKKVVAEGI